MNRKFFIFILMGIIGSGWMIPAPAYSQPAITPNGTLNGGFTIDNSNVIIIAFNRTLQGANTGISLTLPPGVSTITATKDGGTCFTDGFTACNGSLITVDVIGIAGSITITNVAETAGTALFIFAITANPGIILTDCDWEITPAANADMQYARAIPDIISTSDATAASGAAIVSLDGSTSTPVFEPSSLSPAPYIVSYNWTYITGTPALPSFTGTTTATPVFQAPTVTSPTNLEFQVTATDDAGLAATETVTVTINARQYPVDSVLLMDTSGSMGWYKDGSVNDLAGGCCSRLATAKAAAKYFVDRLGTFASDSTLGVAIFPAEQAPSTNYAQEYPSGATPAPVSGFAQIKTDIGAESITCPSCGTAPANPGAPTGIQVHWNGTPTEAGLNQARSMFTITTGRSRIIVLLSDGAHNIGAAPETIVAPFYSTDGIHIYTICMGTGSDNVNTTSLQSVSTNTSTTNGFVQFNLGDPLENLMNYFEKIMRDMVDLDFITDPAVTIGPGNTTTHKALVTSHDSVVSFTVAWQSSQENLLTFSVITPDGITLQPQVTGSGYSNVTVKSDFLDDPATHGEWKIEVTNPTGEEVIYNYSILTKSDLNMRTLLDKDIYFTGDTMRFEVQLIENNRRLTGGTVKVKILKPETGIGNWHFDHNVTKEQLDQIPDVVSGEPLTPVDKKIRILMEQGVKLPDIITEPEIILNDEGKDGDKYPGDGIYGAAYDELNAPGLYKFRISASGEAYNGQKYQRETGIQKFIDMIPDSEITEKEADIEKKLDRGSGIIRVSVIPFDKARNYLGPGYGEEISITSSEGKPEGELEDLLYGAYQKKFLLDDIKKDPRITITVRKVVVYDGPFSELRIPTHNWEISAHVGYPLLHSKFNDILGGGLSGTVDFAYRFTSSWSLELLLGFHYFPDDDLGNSFYWINPAINIKYSFPIGLFRIYANAGAGLYFTETGDMSFGGNAGGGLALAANQGFSLELGYNFHYVMSTNNNQFSVISLGMRFSF